MNAATAVMERQAFLPNWPKRAAFAALGLYILYALSTLEFTWARFMRGLEQGSKFLDRLWPPNFAPDKLMLMSEGLLESVQIALLATSVGILLSIPISLISARNLVPGWLSWRLRMALDECEWWFQFLCVRNAVVHWNCVVNARSIVMFV